jgi:hypothetical protein
MGVRLKKPYAYVLLFGVFLAGCVAQDSSPQTLIEKRCSRCHTLDRVYAVKKDKEGWRTTVERMAYYASGVIREEEIPIITDYLAATQGADRGTETQASGNVEKRR